MYLIPKELKADLRLGKGFTLQDFIFIGIWFLSVSPFFFIIHKSYIALFVIFNLILVVFLLLPSPPVDKMKQWHGLYFWAIDDRKKYVRVQRDSSLLKIKVKGEQENESKKEIT